MSSPWGKIQTVRTLVRGVAVVDTAGHGGLRVSKGFAKERLSGNARSYGTEYGGYLFFEEDCLFPIAMWDLPDLWKIMWPLKSIETIKDELRKSISLYYPDVLIAKGEPVDQESFAQWKINKEISERRAKNDPDLITGAISVNQPDGKSYIKVWTADGLEHKVVPASYRPSGVSLLSQCKIQPSG